VVWSHRCVCLGERKEAPNRAASLLPWAAYIFAQESLASHHIHMCPVVLMEWSLPSWPECVTFLIALKPWWVWVGAILPVL